jgi:hypothetical protein
MQDDRFEGPEIGCNYRASIESNCPSDEFFRILSVLLIDAFEIEIHGFSCAQGAAGE